MCKMHYHSSIPMPEFILTIYVGKIKYKLEMLVNHAKRLNGLSGYLNFIS